VTSEFAVIDLTQKPAHRLPVHQPKVLESECLGYDQEHMDQHLPPTTGYPLHLLCTVLRLDRLVPNPLLHLGMGRGNLHASSDRWRPLGG
jgi:hypothetical protein